MRRALVGAFLGIVVLGLMVLITQGILWTGQTLLPNEGLCGGPIIISAILAAAVLGAVGARK